MRVAAPGGGEIRYTLDGADPDAASPLYEKPLAVSESLTVKARAFKQGMKANESSLRVGVFGAEPWTNEMRREIEEEEEEDEEAEGPAALS